MKPRRDITLGEMQDECKKREAICGLNSDNPCPYDKICDAISPHGFSTDGDGSGAMFPCYWNLTGHPRFNEAQMALLVTMKNIGARHATQRSDAIRFYNIAPLECIAVISKQILNVGETLDLVELFGKDAI